MDVKCNLEVFSRMLVPLHLVLILLWYSVTPPEAHRDLNIPSNCTAALSTCGLCFCSGPDLNVFIHVIDEKKKSPEKGFP